MTSANTWNEWLAEQARRTEIREAGERRAALTRAHGEPVHATEAAKIAGLAKLGRQDVDPAQAMAYVYRDQAAADAWQSSTFEHSHVPSLGTVPVLGGGVLGIYDLRLG